MANSKKKTKPVALLPPQSTNSLKEEENIEELKKQFTKDIKSGWDRGKTPLFIIGAGCTPIDLNQYLHAEWAIRSFRKKNKQPYEGYSYLNFLDIEQKLEEPGKTFGALFTDGWLQIDRPYQTLFFSDLKLKHENKVWEIFCKSFLFDWVCQFEAIFDNSEWTDQESKISKMYRVLSELQNPGENKNTFTPHSKAQILTTNFDGALPEYITNKSKKNCIIISETERIKKLPYILDKFYAINKNSKQNKDPYITILRGDVYHSVCSNEICSSYMKERSVYGVIRDIIQNKKNDREKSNENGYFQLMRCPKIYTSSTEDDTNKFFEIRIILDSKNYIKIQYGPQKIKEQPESEKIQKLIESNNTAITFHSSADNFPPDIFHEVSCNVDGLKTSVYELNWSSIDNNNIIHLELKKQTLEQLVQNAFQHERDIVEQLLRCPECKKSRILNISFPGLEQKEIEIADMMEALWSVLGNSISMICSAGFSGNSDRDVVNYLVQFAEKNNCPWYNITTPTQKKITKIKKFETAVHTTALRVLGINYRVLPIGREEISNLLATAAHSSDLKEKALFLSPCEIFDKTISEATKKNLLQQFSWISEESIQRDNLWIIEDSNRTIPLQRKGFAKTQEYIRGNNGRVIDLKKDFRGLIKGVYEQLAVNDKLEINIHKVSQLALKNFWWDPKKDGNFCQGGHTRLNHSLGVMRVADAWFRHINQIDVFDRETHTSSEPTPTRGALTLRWLECLRFAAIVHDTGHLVFSHLIEDVFREMNWSFTSGEKYSHEQLSKIRAKILLDKILPCDKNMFNDNDLYQAIQDYKNNLLSRSIQIIESNTGICWIDAILNSPIDADKIDYVFRDQQWLGINGRLQKPEIWFSDFLSNMHISPSGQIFLDGRSAVAAFNLISERAYLYDTLYFSPKVRVLESITKEIIKTYFTIKILDGLIPELFKKIFSQGNIPTWDSVKQVLIENSHGISCILSCKRTKNDQSTYCQFTKNFIEKSFEEECTPSNEKLSFVDLGKISVTMATLDFLLMEKRDYSNITKLSTFFENPHEKHKEKLDEFKEIKVLFQDLKDEHTPEVKIIMEICAWSILCLLDESSIYGVEDTTENESHNVLSVKFFRKKECERLAKMCTLVLGPPHTLSDLRQSDPSNARWLEWMFEQHCIAGPYVLRPPVGLKNVHEAEGWLKERKAQLDEIGKELHHLYPGRILLDIIGPLTVRTYSDYRKIRDFKKHPVICDHFWIPTGDPQSWSSKSKASIPLADVDFRNSIPHAYKLRIIVIDPTKNKDGRESRVDHFKQICRHKGIELELMEDYPNA